MGRGHASLFFSGAGLRRRGPTKGDTCLLWPVNAAGTLLAVRPWGWTSPAAMPRYSGAGSDCTEGRAQAVGGHGVCPPASGGQPGGGRGACRGSQPRHLLGARALAPLLPAPHPRSRLRPAPPALLPHSRGVPQGAEPHSYGVPRQLGGRAGGLCTALPAVNKLLQPGLVPCWGRGREGGGGGAGAGPVIRGGRFASTAAARRGPVLAGLPGASPWAFPLPRCPRRHHPPHAHPAPPARLGRAESAVAKGGAALLPSGRPAPGAAAASIVAARPGPAAAAAAAHGAAARARPLSAAPGPVSAAGGREGRGEEGGPPPGPGEGAAGRGARPGLAWPGLNAPPLRPPSAPLGRATPWA